MKFYWDEEHTLEWTQSANPLSITNEVLNVCEYDGCTASEEPKTDFFDGLSLSSNPQTILDGISRLDGWWWFSVGLVQAHPEGLPAWYSESGGTQSSYNANTTKLFVWAPPGELIFHIPNWILYYINNLLKA